MIDTVTGDELQHLALFNPEPPEVTTGRRFLYDARLTSSRGDAACASCHVFGDMDHLGWDLGDPDGEVIAPPGPIKAVADPTAVALHPMKGPMVTQSLRGMANHGAMHWRGDRFDPSATANVQPDTGSFDEAAAFMQFNPAFVSLLGRDVGIDEADMEAFAAFALRLTYPPNPIRHLDNSLTAEQAAGRQIFLEEPSTFGLSCAFCHVLDPAGNAEFGVDAPGFFGTDGQFIGGEFPQTLKIPHLRNLYQKVGRFGQPYDPIINPFEAGAHMGAQIRGFGFLHDGAVDSVFRFIGQIGFDVVDPDPEAGPPEEAGVRGRRKIESFLMAFDSNLAPIVGQQITLRAGTHATVGPRISLLRQRADLGECDLVAHGFLLGRHQGFWYDGGVFRRDREDAPPLADAVLRALALLVDQELTYTCVPPGSGERMGIDRDLDGVLDGDEC